MSILHVNHLKSRIEKDFKEKIDISDLEKKTEDEKKVHFLSRAFAAYSLVVLAGIDSNLASTTIVDGYEDNGIDAIYYDEDNNVFWLVQSKWIQNGNGEPAPKETRAFCDGIRDLIEMKMERFNQKFLKKLTLIQNALDNSSVTIKIVLANTGNQFGEHNKRAIMDLLSDMNDPVELCSFINFDLKLAHKSLADIVDGSPIDLDVMIANWGIVNEPFLSYYGQVNVADVAHWWTDHRSKLVSENIRGFIGSTEVNNDITKTVREQPNCFWYYNNGITALCDSITKKLIGGNDRSTGVFEVRGLKIVNGAQTVGTLGEYFDKNNVQNIDATVMVRFISLHSCPKDFPINVTKATNTQNKVEKKDFVSLDEQQERLRIDFALEGITYQYKRTIDNWPTDSTHCSFDELIVSLACQHSNIDNAVLGKREVGKLWEDVTKKPYTEFFNSGLMTTKAWNCIYTHRTVANYLKQEVKEKTGRLRGIYVHANLFLEHIIFQLIDASQLTEDKESYAIYIEDFVQKNIEKTITQAFGYIESNYETSLMHQIFRNYTKARDIEKAIINE